MTKMAWRLAMAILVATCGANAGVHPDLEKRLRAKAAADLTPIIVELKERASPASGSYFLIAVADGEGVVTETSETNNFANRGFAVTP